jgi:acetoin utilization protein AcuB
MLALSLLNESLTPLRRSDTVRAAREFMAEQGVTELPVLDKSGLYNYVRSILLIDAREDQKLDELIPFNPHAPRVTENQHVYEIIPVLAAADMQVIAVMNEQGEFAGIIDQRHIHRMISQSLTYKGVGAVVVIGSKDKDFAPSQIMRLVEENGAKVLGMMVEHAEHQELIISLKLNTTVVKSIIATLQRFHYPLKGCYMAEDYNPSGEKEYDAVLRFFDL